MKRRNFFIFSCLIVVSLALAPFPGRWGVLKDLLPILAVWPLPLAGWGHP